MRFPFEASLEEIYADLDPYVDAMFSSLESEFLVMPRGSGFVDYPVFEMGYEALKSSTSGFVAMVPDRVCSAILSNPIAIVVLRAMLGFTPSEWGYVASQRTGIQVPQGCVRAIDRRVRMKPATRLTLDGITGKRLQALVETACALLVEGAPVVSANQIHRLDKADTRHGTESIRTMASMGAPYALLLYERFLGRPFAGHRDSVSELVGDVLESAVESVLSQSGISYRKTRRAERLEGFDQAPDFIIPSEFNPQIIIEVKLTEDDGTARDKVTRIQHLGELSRVGRAQDNPKYEVVACIGGRGFAVRREDMKKLILSTGGKVFTLRTLDRLVPYTRLREFATREPYPRQSTSGSGQDALEKPCAPDQA